MGVRVFDESDNCNKSGNATKFTSSHTTNVPLETVLKTKELVGNCKEFRLDSNKCTLRIIGNDNRIRIQQNSGQIQVIGNGTRLKVVNNDGQISYTGNDGRICLGSVSAIQTVDYIGCNGILKLRHNLNENEENLKHSPSSAMKGEKRTRRNAPDRHCHVQGKSFSYGGENSQQWQFMNKIMKKHFGKNFSMPNLKTDYTEDCCCSSGSAARKHHSAAKNAKKTEELKADNTKKVSNTSCTINNNYNFVTQSNSIIINNSVNVRI